MALLSQTMSYLCVDAGQPTSDESMNRAASPDPRVAIRHDPVFRRQEDPQLLRKSFSKLLPGEDREPASKRAFPNRTQNSEPFLDQVGAATVAKHKKRAFTTIRGQHTTNQLIRLEGLSGGRQLRTVEDRIEIAVPCQQPERS